MRVLVCGGRRWGWARYDASKTLQMLAAAQRRQTYAVLDSIHEQGAIDVVINGDAKGADRLSSQWAGERDVEIVRFPADWGTHGRAAGPIRNEEMLRVGRPDIVVAFPGGHGTANMIGQALDANVEVLNVDLPLRIVDEGSDG